MFLPASSPWPIALGIFAATVMLAAEYKSYLGVVAGLTFGIMLADAPVVWLGERMTRVVPLRTLRTMSALLFAVLGAWAALD